MLEFQELLELHETFQISFLSFFYLPFVFFWIYSFGLRKLDGARVKKMVQLLMIKLAGSSDLSANRYKRQVAEFAGSFCYVVVDFAVLL